MASVRLYSSSSHQIRVHQHSSTPVWYLRLWDQGRRSCSTGGQQEDGTVSVALAQQHGLVCEAQSQVWSGKDTTFHQQYNRQDFKSIDRSTDASTLYYCIALCIPSFWQLKVHSFYRGFVPKSWCTLIFETQDFFPPRHPCSSHVADIWSLNCDLFESFLTHGGGTSQSSLLARLTLRA